MNDMPYKSKPYRSRGSIVVDMLEVSKDRGEEGATKTELMYRGNLSFTQASLYIPSMVEAGLLRENPVSNRGNSKVTYPITEEGIRFMNESSFTLERIEVIEKTMQNIKNLKMDKVK